MTQHNTRARPRGGWRVAVAATATALFALGSAVPASADSSGVGWYMDDYGFSELHDQGFTGEGVTIAIAEFTFDQDAPEFQGADIEFVPVPEACTEGAAPENLDPQHGTSVLASLVGQGDGTDGIVQGVVPDARIIAYELPAGEVDISVPINGWSEECPQEEYSGQARAIQATDSGDVDVVSMSVVGGTVSPNNIQLAYMQLKGLPYFQGSGNSARGGADQVSDTATYAGSAAIGSADSSGAASDFSNPGDGLSLLAPGEDIPVRDVHTGELRTSAGTSYAGPIAAGTYALARQAWPDATPEQLLQSLARNVRDGNGELDFKGDELGFGLIDPRAVVATDPSDYPRDNPFVEGKTTYMEDEDPWLAMEDVLIGAPTDQQMMNAQDFTMNIGVDPDSIVWIPEEVEDMVGVSAQDLLGGESTSDENSSDDVDQDRDGLPGGILAALVGGGAVIVLLIVIVTVVLLRQRRR
ncbi:S8 family peptidase [Citricoccus muralis]|uniref:S8/S53 family peptidase n=1 Tax=Citricoccus muralis TaxID=169134 RepID=A0ABY8H7J1_9MICC|nr:S8/S53 family peptidase [Citricoccus muralis]WFP16799.1 S8/S53 family peptidase [Citricoccus muralis]